ncbi:MAG: anaerobic magnesium-protoporphyrin IX monomethyl ester cyclase [Planctomycetota bacterium]|jgi:anaerobic magnesium-protoporphyrin IX monomethyl ester cyclase
MGERWVVTLRSRQSWYHPPQFELAPNPQHRKTSMILKKKRIVLFLPHRADPAQGIRVSADLLPLELLQIAGIPDREGYEVVIVDAMVHDDYMQRLMELCDGALIFGSSCILGYQVAHGAEVAKAIRQRFPDLPIIWGGWFPSVVPEQYLEEGIADAVCLGQGEFTFWDYIQAVDNGEDIADVAGLVILRDGKPHYTAHRKIVGFNDIPDVPWHLIDFEEYVRMQNDNSNEWKVRHKYANPWDWKPGTELRGFSYYSSFGCPEPCTFCCSPGVTNRRWKAIPGGILGERIMECHERFNFNVLRFQDANFGVAEKRSNEFCDSLIEAKAPFWWNGTYEIETIARYRSESLDKLAASRFHMAALGAEAGTEEQQTRIGKKIDIRNNLGPALNSLNKRGIQTSVSWIIGYPEETAQSMLDTITVAAKTKHMFPNSPSDVFPFRAIPGSADYDTAVKLGYEKPKTLVDWGDVLEYKYEIGGSGLPEDVVRRWRRYGVTSTFYDGLAKEGSGFVRDFMRKISGWRLRTNNFDFPLEQKLFHTLVRISGNRTQENTLGTDKTSTSATA